jgi:hypothetical protein
MSDAFSAGCGAPKAPALRVLACIDLTSEAQWQRVDPDRGSRVTALSLKDLSH